MTDRQRFTARRDDRSSSKFDFSNIVGLSVRQPWASLLALAFKTDEIRSWCRNIHGTVAIHASLKFTAYEKRVCLTEPVFSQLVKAKLLAAGAASLERPDFSLLPFGAIVAVSRFDGCVDVASNPGTALLERQLGEDITGLFSFPVYDVSPLPQPIPCKGALGFWKVPPAVRRNLAKQLLR